MRYGNGMCLLAMAAFAPVALANNNNGDDLDKVSLPALQGASIDFKPGEGFKVNGGDEFSLQLTNRIQVQWAYANRDNVADQMTFQMRRVRTFLGGHVFSPATRYRLQFEWNSNGGNTLDAFIEQDLWNNEEWSLSGRAGSMKTFFGKESTGTAKSLMFVERSLAARTLSGDDRRAVGALFNLKGMDNHLFVHAGVFNAGQANGSTFGSGHLTANADNELNYTVGGRYEFGEDMGDEWFEQGDLAASEEMQASVHANIWIGNERGATGDVDVFAYNIGGAVKTGGISALAEWFGWNADPDGAGATTDQDATGFNVHGTYTSDGMWGFGARVSMVNIDNPLTGGAGIFPASTGMAGLGTALTTEGEVLEFSLAASRFYNMHNRKLQADITFQSVDPDSGTSQDNIIFRVMATIQI